MIRVLQIYERIEDIKEEDAEITKVKNASKNRGRKNKRDGNAWGSDAVVVNLKIEVAVVETWCWRGVAEIWCWRRARGRETRCFEVQEGRRTKARTISECYGFFCSKCVTVKPSFFSTFSCSKSSILSRCLRFCNFFGPKI